MRCTIRGMLSFAVIILSLAIGIVVAASGEVVTPSPTATSTASSIKSNTGGSAPWGFVVAIVAAIAIFIAGGLLIVLRSRREYLDEQARKAALSQEDD